MEFKFAVDVRIDFDVVFKVVEVVDDWDPIFVFVGKVVVLCVVNVVFWLSLTSIEGTPFNEGIKSTFLAGSVMLKQLMEKQDI